MSTQIKKRKCLGHFLPKDKVYYELILGVRREEKTLLTVKLNDWSSKKLQFDWFKLIILKKRVKVNTNGQKKKRFFVKGRPHKPFLSNFPQDFENTLVLVKC